MTTTSPAPGGPPLSPHVVRSGVACLVIGPVAVLVQWLITPVDATLKTPELVARVADHHQAMGWTLALDVPLLLVFPAVLYVGHLARAGTSLFAGIATAVCFLPMLGGVILLGLDGLLFEASTQPDQRAAARLVDAFVTNPFVSGLTSTYLLTHVVGFTLLAVALRRARVVPTWASVCLALWPIVEMAGYVAGGKAVAAVGYAALVAGYGACAVALVRTGRSRAAHGHATREALEPA
jgi:hypothetical protein